MEGVIRTNSLAGMESKSFPSDNLETTWSHIPARAYSRETVSISQECSCRIHCDSYEWYSQYSSKVLWVPRLKSYQHCPASESMLVSLYIFRPPYLHDFLLSTAFSSSQLLGWNSCVWLLPWVANCEHQSPKSKAKGCDKSNFFHCASFWLECHKNCCKSMAAFLK